MKKILSVLFVLTVIAALSVSAMAAEDRVVDTTISAPVLAADPDKETDALDTHTVEIPAGEVNMVQPINVAARGRLYIKVLSHAPAQRSFDLYSDEACTSPVNTGYRYVAPNEAKQFNFIIEKAGTYYLKIHPNNSMYVSTDSGSIDLVTYVASAEDRTLSSGKYTVGAPSSSNQVTYYKISVSEAGYIGFLQSNPSGNTFSVELCNNSKTKIAGVYLGSSNVYYPVKKGTYYLKTEGVYSGYADWYRLKYTFYKQTSSTFTMTNNKQKKMIVLDGFDYYLRIKAEKTGTLTLTNSATYGAYVTLCTSKKTAASNEKYLSNASVSYAVTKGKTYYLKVSGVIGDSFSLKYKIASVSTGSNTTKAKAVTLKKNKAQKLNFITGSTKSFWFKFKASASVSLNVDSTFAGLGNYDVVIYKGSKNEGSATMTPLHTYIYTTGKLAKGTTYYLKFTPKKLTSGTLTLKLKS